jgi:hypothetical protein
MQKRTHENAYEVQAFNGVQLGMRHAVPGRMESYDSEQVGTVRFNLKKLELLLWGIDLPRG